MQNSSISQNFKELVNINISLICGENEVSLVDFSDKLEKLIIQLVENKIKREEIQGLLLNVEAALKKKDLIHLLDVVQNIKQFEGVNLIAETS